MPSCAFSDLGFGGFQHPGIDCIDGCRFALVFPIVVAHFARFSTNNLTALKLLTQEHPLDLLSDSLWDPNVIRLNEGTPTAAIV